MLLSDIKSMISVEEILQAHQRVKEVIQVTPFTRHANLSDEYKANIFLKREDMQVVRSFKIRGAYNKIRSLNSEDVKSGVVCASAGNHAQGVALTCSKLGIKGIIYMPHPTPQQKINKVKHFGGQWVEVILFGDSFDEAQEAANIYAQQEKIPFIHPFDDDVVIAGQGTIAIEMTQQVMEDMDVLLIAVGGGGLMSGIGSYYKQVSPKTKIIAVEAKGAPSLYQSLIEGHVVQLTSIDTFADGIAVKQMGKRTFEICQSVVDDSILVDEGKICSTILKLYNEEAIVAEPAGAIAIAALDQIKDYIQGKNVGIVVCGGNNDVNRTQEIKEKALLFENKKHYFLIRFPQRAGALRDFLNVLGPNDDITHFQYTKKNNRSDGPALVGIELADSQDFRPLIERLQKEGINYQHINDNPMLFEILV